ncbi:hypothetical protein Pelo_14859 [Pelomyxa schiedti]|nr:hypothetical protein Pelo_14859 [Pelomyxa schiedti]
MPKGKKSTTKATSKGTPKGHNHHHDEDEDENEEPTTTTTSTTTTTTTLTKKKQAKKQQPGNAARRAKLFLLNVTYIGIVIGAFVCIALGVALATEIFVVSPWVVAAVVLAEGFSVMFFITYVSRAKSSPVPHQKPPKPTIPKGKKKEE